MGSVPVYYRRSCEDCGDGRPWEEMGRFFAPVTLMLAKAHSHNSYHSQKEVYWEWPLGYRRLTLRRWGVEGSS